MPSDDYTSVGGALRLKGSKVKKHKKKRDKGSDLEKSLAGGETSTPEESLSAPKHEDASADEKPLKNPSDKKEEDDDEAGPVNRKTEAEQRFEEAQRKKFLKMSESASARPELLKTHKQRVEELNTYLSKLSEHHDMPKIGPG